MSIGENAASCLSSESIEQCAAIIRSFYAHGWVFGTGGNFSVVLSRDPFRLGMTSSSIDKSAILPEHFLVVDAAGKVLEGAGVPTAEAGLHHAVLELVDAGAVFHTHSVWATVLSSALASQNGLTFEGDEMLKGLHGVESHTHREWLPIIENSQDISELGGSVRQLLAERPDSHGFLIRGHGLYTWGRTIQEAKQHVEILEFLLEVTGRRRAMLLA